jgi:TRAP-type C4-dicarboxylate transport system permease small subunit
MFRKFLSAYERFMDFVDKIIIFFSSLSILLMASIIVAGVIFRYFLNNPLSWSDEAGRYLLVFITFVGAIPMITRGGFGQVESIIGKLSPNVRQKFNFIIHIFSLLFTGVAAGISIYLVFFSVAIQSQVTPALEIPMWIIYSALPLGFTIMFLRELQLFLKAIVDAIDNKQLITGKEEAEA